MQSFYWLLLVDDCETSPLDSQNDRSPLPDAELHYLTSSRSAATSPQNTMVAFRWNERPFTRNENRPLPDAETQPPVQLFLQLAGLLQKAHVEFLRSGFLNELQVGFVVKNWGAGENPQIFPVRISYDRVRVIRR